MSRRTRFAPIRPRPTMPSCIPDSLSVARPTSHHLSHPYAGWLRAQSPSPTRAGEGRRASAPSRRLPTLRALTEPSGPCGPEGRLRGRLEAGRADDRRVQLDVAGRALEGAVAEG